LYTLGAPQRDWLAEQQALGTAVGDSMADRPRRLPSRPPLGAVPPRARSVYAGAYANRYYGRVIVRPGAGAGLDVKLGRGDTVRYVPWNGDTWCQPDTGTAAVFTVRDGRSESVKVMMLHSLGRNGVFERSS
jgi:hypothetical protein